MFCSLKLSNAKLILSLDAEKRKMQALHVQADGTEEYVLSLYFSLYQIPKHN